MSSQGTDGAASNTRTACDADGASAQKSSATRTSQLVARRLLVAVMPDIGRGPARQRGSMRRGRSWRKPRRGPHPVRTMRLADRCLRADQCACPFAAPLASGRTGALTSMVSRLLSLSSTTSVMATVSPSFNCCLRFISMT